MSIYLIYLIWKCCTLHHIYGRFWLMLTVLRLIKSMPKLMRSLLTYMDGNGISLITMKVCYISSLYLKIWWCCTLHFFIKHFLNHQNEWLNVVIFCKIILYHNNQCWNWLLGHFWTQKYFSELLFFPVFHKGKIKNSIFFMFHELSNIFPKSKMDILVYQVEAQSILYKIKLVAWW